MKHKLFKASRVVDWLLSCLAGNSATLSDSCRSVLELVKALED